VRPKSYDWKVEIWSHLKLELNMSFCSINPASGSDGSSQLKQSSLLIQPACLVSLSASSSCLPRHPAWLVSLSALSSCLVCHPACYFSMSAFSACLAILPGLSSWLS